MAKRTKRLEKGVKSIKAQIEKHFQKLEKDIKEGNIDRGRYHLKEIDKSLLIALEIRLKILNIPTNLIDSYRKKLKNCVKN